MCEKRLQRIEFGGGREFAVATLDRKNRKEIRRTEQSSDINYAAMPAVYITSLKESFNSMSVTKLCHNNN